MENTANISEVNQADLAMYEIGLEINRIDLAISKLQEEKAYNKAWIILTDASKTLIHNEVMAKYNDGQVETELFYRGADFDMFYEAVETKWSSIRNFTTFKNL